MLETPIYFVRDADLIAVCRSLFTDATVARIFVRCPDSTPIVADRSQGAVSRDACRFLDDVWCDRMARSVGVSETPPAPASRPQAQFPWWMRLGRRFERWRRVKFTDTTNLVIDDAIAVTVQTMGPGIAAMTGAKLSSAAVVERRLHICRTCDQYRNGTCMKCGCNSKFKARLSGNGELGCPLDKW